MNYIVISEYTHIYYCNTIFYGMLNTICYLIISIKATLRMWIRYGLAGHFKFDPITRLVNPNLGKEPKLM